MRFTTSILLLLMTVTGLGQTEIRQSTFVGNVNISVDGNIFIADQFKDIRPELNYVNFVGGPLEISLSMLDTIQKGRFYISNRSLLEARYLQFRLHLNGKLIQDWTAAASVGEFKRDTIMETIARPPSYRPGPNEERVVIGKPLKSVNEQELAMVRERELNEQYFIHHFYLLRKILYKDQLAVGDSLRIDIKHFDNQSFSSSTIITRMRVTPKLDNVLMDEMIDQFFMRPKQSEALSETALRPVPKADTSAQLKDLSLPSDTKKVLLLFSNAGTIDSSLMVCQVADDSNNWKLSGHKVLINDLKPGSTRELLIHYKLQPESTIRYTITTERAWYQTNTFKWSIIIAGVLVLLLSIYLLYRYSHKKQKQREEKVNLQLKSIRSQLNPHFVFNALSSIQGLINNNEIDKANMYLSEFGTLMRNTLSGNNLISNNLASEIKMIERYLQLEQLRFGFRFNIETDPLLDLSGTEIPSLLIQPIVENAVKHGVSSLLDKGLVEVTFKQNNNDLVITISDNGKGFAQNNKKGDGMRLTSDRVSLLNEVNKGQAIEYITDSSVDGTKVYLNFKNWL